MKISLVCNVRAGQGVAEDQLRRAIEAGGHEIVAMLEPIDELARALDPRTELVVVAGGDGTVRRVATGLAGRRIPLAIVPSGTANNIATSLGIDGPADQLIARWQPDRRVPLDLGIATGPWGERRFIESVGTGLVACGIAAMDTEAPHGEAPGALITKALSRFRDVLGGLAAHPCQLTLDGVATEAELLLVEILNIRAVGPNLLLSPGADPTDGWFEVVTAGERDRPELERYLRDRLAGRPANLELPGARACHVEITGPDRLHLDDDVVADLAPGAVTLRLERAAVEILGHGPEPGGSTRAPASHGASCHRVR